MSRVILLDSTPLSLAADRPGRSPQADGCQQWIRDCLSVGASIVVPELADYEVRRELLRAGKAAGIRRLDAFINAVPGRYLPVSTEAWRLAADLWAQARNGGYATADPKALDGDVIVAAQALLLQRTEPNLIVATNNVAHLGRYVAADVWQNITP